MSDTKHYYHEDLSYLLEDEVEDTGRYFRFMGDFFLVLEKEALHSIHKILLEERSYVEFRIEPTNPVLLNIDKTKAYSMVKGSGTLNQEFMTMLRNANDTGSLKSVYCSANDILIPIKEVAFRYLRGEPFTLEYESELKEHNSMSTPVLVVLCVMCVDSEMNKSIGIVMLKDNQVWKTKGIL